LGSQSALFLYNHTATNINGNIAVIVYCFVAVGFGVSFYRYASDWDSGD
jgi:hypothetical protein